MKYNNILLIDDDLEDQEIFHAALAVISGEASCTSLSSGVEALKQLSDQTLRPDVIFLDLNMPVMSGQEFLSKIKHIDALKSIPVIIFSTSSNEATKAATRHLGASGFITKPNRFDALIDILKPILK